VNELQIQVRSIRGSNDPEHAVAVDDWVLAGVGGSALTLNRHSGDGAPIRFGLGFGVVDGVRTVVEQLAGAPRDESLGRDLESAYSVGRRQARLVQDRYGTSPPDFALVAMRPSGEFAMVSTGLPIYLADSDVLVRVDPIIDLRRSDPVVGMRRSLRPHQMLIIATMEIDPVLGQEWAAGPTMDSAQALGALGEELNAVCNQPGCLLAVWLARRWGGAELAPHHPSGITGAR